MAEETPPTASFWRRLRDYFVRPSSFPLIAVVAVGLISGLVFWGGFNTAMEATNSLAFCTGCHEMDTVYSEYKESIHYKNPAGVRAACPDCHVPKDWTHKFVRKVQASRELWGKYVTHVIDTPEKFEVRRMELAENVWKTMKDSDSRECRNCHSFDAMNFEKQHPRGAKAMQKGMKEGKTCIDCHKGIAHLLPKEYHEDEE